MLLNSLPKYISLGVCNDWLSAIDVSLLDSATCNSVERPTFLHLLEAMKVSCLVGAVATKKYCTWLSLRNVKVLKLVFNQNSKMFSGNEKLKCLESVRSLSMNNLNDRGFANIIVQCAELVELELKADLLSTLMRIIAEKSNHLKVLKLTISGTQDPIIRQCVHPQYGTKLEVSADCLLVQFQSSFHLDSRRFSEMLFFT